MDCLLSRCKHLIGNPPCSPEELRLLRLSSHCSRHAIQPNLWRSLGITVDCSRNTTVPAQLCHCSTKQGDGRTTLVTLQCAINTWFDLVVMAAGSDMRVRLLDTCDGASCNGNCPEAIQLGKLTDDWSTAPGTAVLFCTIIYVLSALCLFYKAYMILRMVRLLAEQSRFLERDEPKSSKKQVCD